MSDKPKYDNSGILFFQDDKDAENKPDWKGNITIKGEELELAGWIKPGKRGNFITLKASEKRRKDVSSEIPATSPKGKFPSAPTAQQDKAAGYPLRGGPPDDQFDDDIPF